jgi:hypothetical protein
METQKHQKEMMQAVKKLLLYVLILLFSNCYSQKIEKNYIIKKFKSNDNFSSYLNLDIFEYKKKRKLSHSVYRINNVIFSKHKSSNLIINVLPGKFKIESGYIGKKWIELENFEVKKGDSIVMSFYLKDIKEPFVNNEGDIINIQKKNH